MDVQGIRAEVGVRAPDGAHQGLPLDDVLSVHQEMIEDVPFGRREADGASVDAEASLHAVQRDRGVMKPPGHPRLLVPQQGLQGLWRVVEAFPDHWTESMSSAALGADRSSRLVMTVLAETRYEPVPGAFRDRDVDHEGRVTTP